MPQPPPRGDFFAGCFARSRSLRASAMPAPSSSSAISSFQRFPHTLSIRVFLFEALKPSRTALRFADLEEDYFQLTLASS
jgi:hypothetical protein